MVALKPCWLFFLLLGFGCMPSALADVHAIYKPGNQLSDTSLFTIQQEAMRYIPDEFRYGIDFVVQSNIDGGALRHVSFNIKYQQAVCWGAYVKMSVTPQAKVFMVQVHWPSWDSVASTYENAAREWENCDTATLFQTVEANRLNVNIYKVWHPMKGFCFAMDAWHKTYDYTLFFNPQGRILDSISHARYYGRDTFVHGRIFNPDPLSVQGFYYGGSYTDNQDADAPWFSSAYRTVKVPARFNSQLNEFELKSNWVSLEEFELPNIPPVQQSNQAFLFNRSESGFEDVMVMYHIMQCRNWLTQLGYNHLMNLPVHVDAHAQFGADNSVFVRNGGDPALRFGTGGVDDAEDADVILHEYAHGLSWSANQNNNFSFERSGLDEGLADYWATSYSRRLLAFRWNDVFTWDGHNEFWNGRTASTNNYYPSSGNLYQVGEIWNAAMSNIWSDLGADVADRLQLESMHFYTEQTSLPEAALFVLDADTLLYNGVHTAQICQRFQQQGILNSNCLPTSAMQVQIIKSQPYIINTHGFCFNGQMPELVFPSVQEATYTWWSSDGRKLYSEKLEPVLKSVLNGPSLTNGFYILHVQTATGNYRFPLLKVQ